MPKRSKKQLRPLNRGTQELTAPEKRLRETLGDKADELLRFRLEAPLVGEIARLAAQLLMLRKADPEVMARAVEVFESERNAAMWLVSPQPFSKSATPLDLAVTASGRENVLRELGRIEHGVFS